MAQNSANQLIGTLETQFVKLPPLPKTWRDIIVNVTPWIALVFGVLGVLGSLAAFGFTAFFSPLIALGGGIGAATGGIIGSVLAFIASVLMVAAFPGTRARKLSGWNLLFWSEVVSTVASVVAFSISGVVGALIGFYILFQIKSHYK